MLDPIDALFVIIKMIVVAMAIDVALLLVIWRIKVHMRNVDRRMRHDKRNDIWFSEESQKELYRDFV